MLIYHYSVFTSLLTTLLIRVHLDSSLTQDILLTGFQREILVNSLLRFRHISYLVSHKVVSHSLFISDETAERFYQN